MADAFDAWLKEIAPASRFVVLVQLLVAAPMRFNGVEAEGFARVAKIAGVDLAVIKAAVAAELTPQKKAKAAKPKKLSPEEIDATVRKLHGEGKAAVEIYLATHISKRVIGKIIAKIEAESGGGKKKKSGRVVIDDDIRSDVRRRIEAGQTNPEISEMLGLSLPQVQNIKKALGLMKGAHK